jgi:hypothetical protein
MKANRELGVMYCVAQQWPPDESLHWHSEDEEIEWALCRLENDDPKLEGISLYNASLSLWGVNAIASHSTLKRVDFECDVKSLLWTETKDALINALRENTSIKIIGVTMWDQDLSAIIEVVNHSQ